MKMKMLVAAVAVVAAFFAACTSKTADTKAEALTVDSLERVLPGSVGDTVEVEGLLARVCAQTGKKACMVNADSSFTLCLTAAPDFTFAPELAGKNVTVKGVVREDSLTNEVLAAMVASYVEAPDSLKTGCAKGACCAAACEDTAAFAARIQELYNRLDARKLADGKEYVSVYTIETVACDAK